LRTLRALSGKNRYCCREQVSWSRADPE